MLTFRAYFVLILAALALASVTGAGLAREVGVLTGTAHAVDGDTLDLRGQRVRLFGVDAPEQDQPCGPRGKVWPCGKRAAQDLAGLIAGKTLRCTARDTDRYGRIVAICEAEGVDLGRAMVRSGMALAYRRYSQRYVGDEAAARSAKAGLWSGPFVAPWDWRHRSAPRPAERAPKGVAVAGDCVIKGNISRSGAIYHRPGQRDYDATRIDPSRGERWFCTEAEARAAGFRPAAR